VTGCEAFSRTRPWTSLECDQLMSELPPPTRVAILGTRGVPASYGGFETAVEEIGKRLAARGYSVTVYCRNPGQDLTEYEGMRLVNLPALRHRMTETLSHTSLSAVHAAIRDRPDVALVLNAGNAPFLRPLRAAGIPVAVHLDGLEASREKWRGAGAAYYRWAEKAAVRGANEVISDASAIADRVHSAYGRESVVIPYGADVIAPGHERLAEHRLVRRDYHLIVARMEPENHVLDAVHGYRMSDETRPLVVVGSAPYSQWYIDKVHEAAGGDDRIRFLGGIYDKELLDQLYGNCRTYIHGHSVGGTNPSLLRAMGAGAPVLAFDCEFNREVTDNQALFWSSADQLTQLFDDIADGELDEDLASFSASGQQRVAEHYQWDAVTDAYEGVIQRMGTISRRVAAKTPAVEPFT
jgi:glycosyltransferase involved in cell wall biosynthesis